MTITSRTSMLPSADIPLLKKKWEDIAFDIHSELSDFWFSFMVDKYSESHRFYHTLTHVQSLLEHAEKYASRLKDSHAVCWAIWFHDVVYDPQSRENEYNSNQVWLRFVQETKKTDIDTVQLVQAMILGSAQHTLSHLPKELLKKNDEDVLSFFDFDLSILSSEPKIYGDYAQAIRKEYAYVPDKLYQEGRAKVLENFLSRKIYCTDAFIPLETQARENLKHELVKLKNI